jgi:hypothetical protein
MWFLAANARGTSGANAQRLCFDTITLATAGSRNKKSTMPLRTSSSNGPSSNRSNENERAIQRRSNAASLALAKHRQHVPLNGESCLQAKRKQLLFWKAYLDVDHAPTMGTRQVMVVLSSAYPIMMYSIGKLNPIEQTDLYQHLDRPIDRGSPYLRLFLPQSLPEVINRKIGSYRRQFNQTLSDELAWSRIALPRLSKCFANALCTHHRLSLLFPVLLDPRAPAQKNTRRNSAEHCFLSVHL